MKKTLILLALVVATGNATAAASKWKTTGLQQANSMGAGAARELRNVATLYPGELPRISGDNAHINAEGQIMLGKFTASAIEEFYRTKASQTKGSSIRRENQ